MTLGQETRWALSGTLEVRLREAATDRDHFLFSGNWYLWLYDWISNCLETASQCISITPLSPKTSFKLAESGSDTGT